MTQITQFLTAHGGLILFVAAFFEQSGLPIPAAPWLLAAGALSAGGHMSLLAAVVWATIGSLLADVTWFWIGHRGKGWVFKLFPRLRSVQYASVRRPPIRLMARGLRKLTAAKFLPFGTVVPLRAGALHVNSLRFVVLDAISSAVYACVYVLLGLFFHNQLTEVVALAQRLGFAALVLLVVLVGGYVAFGFLKRGRRETAQLAETGTKLEASHV